MILAAFNLITVYVILGPFVWFGAFVLMAFGWSRVNRLRKISRHSPKIRRR